MAPRSRQRTNNSVRMAALSTRFESASLKRMKNLSFHSYIPEVHKGSSKLNGTPRRAREADARATQSSYLATEPDPESG